MKVATKTGQVVTASRIPPPDNRVTAWEKVLREAMAVHPGQAILLRGIGYIFYCQIKSIVKYRQMPLRVIKRREDVYLERLEG